MHKFYLLKWTSKLYNPFFRVVFHLSVAISWCNFLKLTLWPCQLLGKRPGNLCFSMKLCSQPDTAHCELGHVLKLNTWDLSQIQQVLIRPGIFTKWDRLSDNFYILVHQVWIWKQVWIFSSIHQFQNCQNSVWGIRIKH